MTRRKSSLCKHNQIGGVLQLVALSILLGGCSVFGLPDSSFLAESLPQSHRLGYSAAAVWGVISEEAESLEGGRILAVDEESRTISWISSVVRGSDFHQSLADPKLSKRTRSVPAITVARIEELERGCRLHVRQTYFPADTRAGISPSRGTFERFLLTRLRQRLRSQISKERVTQ